MDLRESFHREKYEKCQRKMSTMDIDGLFLMNPHNIMYLSGFSFGESERPVALYGGLHGNPILFIPRLMDAQLGKTWVEDVQIYDEYPGSIHPVDKMCHELSRRGYDNLRLGFEERLPFTYSERIKHALPRANLMPDGKILESMRLEKSPEEIRLIKQASHYSDYMLDVAVGTLQAGELRSELDLLQMVVDAVVNRMKKDLDGFRFTPRVVGGGISSGARSASPHVVASNHLLKRGDVLMLSFYCSVGGYYAESERTVFLGMPSDRQLDLYQAVRQAQEIGFRSMRVGAKCSDIDKTSLNIIREAGYGKLIKHRSGHGIGLEHKEPPWIGDGEDRSLREGMVVSCEPAVYDPEVGGFRISDTVMITEGGPKRLTTFPRDVLSVI